MSKPKAKQDFLDPVRQGPLFSVRFLISLLLIGVGIAYVVIWTLYLRDLHTFDTTFGEKRPSKPDTLIPGQKKLDDWNWVIGFGLLFIGLALAAHPKTPLGRGRGVLVGMLGSFVIGLILIFTFYVFADKIGSDPNSIWLLGNLGQLNLVVGIGFMAVGFTYATKWE